MFSSSPYTSSCVWSQAPLPTRTGRESRQPRRCGSSRSERSCSPPIPYMIWSEPSFTRPPAQLVMKETKFSASSGQVADVERLEREARVPDPREAVVPVALAALVLGQRRRGRGDDRAGRAVGEALQHARAEAAPAPGAGPRRCRAPPPTSARPRPCRRSGSATAAARRGLDLGRLDRRPAQREVRALALGRARTRRASSSPRCRPARTRVTATWTGRRTCGRRPRCGGTAAARARTRGAAPARAAAPPRPRRTRRRAAPRAASPCRGRARAGPRRTPSRRSGARRRSPW